MTTSMTNLSRLQTKTCPRQQGMMRAGAGAPLGSCRGQFRASSVHAVTLAQLPSCLPRASRRRSSAVQCPVVQVPASQPSIQPAAAKQKVAPRSPGEDRAGVCRDRGARTPPVPRYAPDSASPGVPETDARGGVAHARHARPTFKRGCIHAGRALPPFFALGKPAKWIPWFCSFCRRGELL